MKTQFGRIVATFLVGSFALSGAALSTGCKGGRFGNMISKSEEVQLGRSYGQQIDRQEPLITSGPQYDRLQRVSARILPLADRDFDVDYSVKLIDKNEINAFALPGGPIYFYKGIVDLAQSDAELASIVGHEAGHVVKRHSAQQMSDANTKGLIAQVLLGRSGNVAQTLAGIGLQLDQLKFSRSDGSQSDEVGFKYLTEAGYDPYGQASMFRRMQEKAGRGGGPEWLASHPLTQNRVKAAEERAKAYTAGRAGN